MKGRGMELLAEHGVERSPPIQTALDLFGIRLVHHVLQKPDASRGTWASLHDIGHAFAQDIANLSGITFASPWEKKKRTVRKTHHLRKGPLRQGIC